MLSVHACMHMRFAVCWGVRNHSAALFVWVATHKGRPRHPNTRREPFSASQQPRSSGRGKQKMWTLDEAKRSQYTAFFQQLCADAGGVTVLGTCFLFWASFSHIV